MLLVVVAIMLAKPAAAQELFGISLILLSRLPERILK